MADDNAALQAGGPSESELGGDDEKMTQFVSFVEEAREVKELLANFEKTEDAHTRIVTILEKYQEQAELLDPHLEDMVTPLMSMVRNNMKNKALVDRCFKVIYSLAKVRGYKTVVKFFPHEVVDLEPTLSLLKQQSFDDHTTWETRYGLLLWLSIIVLIPFDLRTVDSEIAAHGGAGAAPQGIIAEIIMVGQKYLADTGAPRDAAAIMLARLFSRPDMHASHLAKFFDYCNAVLQDDKASIFLLSGAFSTLAHIFKIVSRDALLDKIGMFYDSVINNEKWSNSNSGMLRKLKIKLAQRIGLTYLPPRVATWRYQRGNRFLLQSLGGASGTAQQTNQADEKADDANVEVPEQIDDIVGHLLDGLRDRDTVVRWSAAKGIGRITMRLPSSFADDIVGSVLDLFSPTEGDGAWHGGCLALAELARRGLLLPERLSAVVPVVISALVYDVRKGAHSVGAHVRDAACYVCWAFARAYAPEVMQPYVQQLAPQLLTVAVFDREINCRRAASAAFQENVGRQGNFPHGIDINTTADYFTLGNRNSAYLVVSVEIAKYQEYTQAFIDHLVKHKVKHWDQAVRELTSQALHNLVHRSTLYFSDNILPRLVPLTLSKDLAERHGAVLAVAEIVRALRLLGVTIPDKLRQDIVHITAKVDKAKYLTGRGGATMRGAVLRLIECIANAQFPLEMADVKSLLSAIEQNLPHPDEDIQMKAAVAGRAFARQYFPDTPSAIEQFRPHLLSYIAVANKPDPSPYHRRGVCRLLGLLPSWLVRDQVVEVVDALVACTQVDERKDFRDAETRRNATTALGQVCIAVGCHATITVMPEVKEQSLLDRVGSALLNCLNDYSTDNRGDVGSWVREAAMVGLELITLSACGHNVDPFTAKHEHVLTTPSLTNQPTTFSFSGHASPLTALELQQQTDTQKSSGGHVNLITPQFSHTLCAALTKQMAERINRLREHAGVILHAIVHSSPSVPHVPDRQQLQQIFPAHLSTPGSFDWSAPSSTFPLCVELLKLENYCRPVLEGLVLSVGGLTESLVKHSGDALVTYAQSASGETKEGANGLPPAGSMARLGTDLVWILQKYKHDLRVVVPVLKTLDLLFNNGCFESLTPDCSNFTRDLYTALRAEVKNSTDVVKLMSSVNVFLGLVPFPEPTRTSAVKSVLALLGNRFPKVRRVSAEQMYNKLVAFDVGLSEDKLDEVLAILSDTVWDGDVATMFQKRDSLYPLFGLDVPATQPLLAAATASAASAAAARKEEELTYADFIGSLK